MSEEKSIYEILTDESDTDNVVLQDDEGNDIEFEQIATINMDDKIYCILHPLDLEDMDDDVAVVFEIKEDSDQLEVVVDDDVVEGVFNEYYRLCAEDDE